VPLAHLPKLETALDLLRGRPVFFIGGSPKSGTTWLQLLHDSHPGISCRGEAHIPDDLAPLVMQAAAAYSDRIDERNTRAFPELAPYPRFDDEDVLSLLAVAAALVLGEHARDATPGAVIGEKTPDNVRSFPLLLRLFPQAKFLHIVRDGRDCAVSGWWHNQRSEPEWTRQTFSSFHAYACSFAERWAKDLEAGLDFAAQHPGSSMLIRYEDLLADPDAVLARSFGFLGVAADDALVADCVRASAFSRLSGRDPGKEDRTSFFRKGVRGEWVREFDAAMLAAFRERAGQWLARFGYDDPPSTR
jgi:hypothetical protein